MSLLMPILLLASYGAALVAVHRRWRWEGVLALAALVALSWMVVGTLEWRRPHTDPVQLAPFDDWKCHSLDVLPMLLIFTAAGLGALRLVRPHASSWRVQLVAVGAAFALAIVPAALLQLYVGIQLWACDTL